MIFTPPPVLQGKTSAHCGIPPNASRGGAFVDYFLWSIVCANFGKNIDRFQVKPTDRVYRARTKPKKRGIIVFESLTAERLAMVNNLKVLKQGQGSNILSYYTQTGKVLVRTSENKETKPLEVPVGSTKDQIRDICRGKKVVLSSTDVLNQFRKIHGGNQSSDRTDPNSNAGAWQTFTSRRTKARGADGSASNGNPSQTESRSSDT